MVSRLISQYIIYVHCIYICVYVCIHIYAYIYVCIYTQTIHPACEGISAISECMPSLLTCASCAMARRRSSGGSDWCAHIPFGSFAVVSLFHMHCAEEKEWMTVVSLYIPISYPGRFGPFWSAWCSVRNALVVIIKNNTSTDLHVNMCGHSRKVNRGVSEAQVVQERTQGGASIRRKPICSSSVPIKVFLSSADASRRT